MGKNTGTSQDLDNLSMLNLWEEEEATNEIDESNWGWMLDGVDLPKVEEETPAVEISDDSTEADLPEEVTEEQPETDTTETAPVEGDENAVEDFDAMIQELIKSWEELEDKVQEVVDEAETSENPKLKALVKELQIMNAEKNTQLDEVAAERDVWKSKYMERFSEDTDLSVYKPEIEVLENNSKLRSLIKYRNNDNEKVSEKVTKLISDLFYERTWQDISEMLDEKDRAWVEAVLNSGTSETQPAPEMIPEEEPEIGREDSLNSLLWM